MGNIRVAFPGESQLRQSRATQPTMHAGCFVVVVCVCLHNPPNSDMDDRIFNVHTYVKACDCTRGCTGTDTVRESALKVDPWKIGDSNLRHRRAGPTLNQLSYIPTLIRYSFPLAPPPRSSLSASTSPGTTQRYTSVTTTV